jgi:hypothetical protein
MSPLCLASRIEPPDDPPADIEDSGERLPVLVAEPRHDGLDRYVDRPSSLSRLSSDRVAEHFEVDRVHRPLLDPFVDLALEKPLSSRCACAASLRLRLPRHCRPAGPHRADSNARSKKRAADVVGGATLRKDRPEPCVIDVRVSRLI